MMMRSVIVEGRFNRKKLMVMLTLTSVLLAISLTVNVIGAGNLIPISAHLNNGITVMLNGKAFEPKDSADGSKYVPITYKGRTYLPLRAVIEEAAGLQVTWDAKTSTAYIGEVSGTIDKDQITYIRVTPEFGANESHYKLLSRTPEYLNRAPEKKFEYGYANDPGYYAGIQIRVNTNYEYDKFKATFWIDEEKDENGEYTGGAPTIEFKDESGVEVKKLDVEYGKQYEVEISIKDVSELEVWASGSLSIIGEPMIGK
jgi:hypothetical protein